MPKTTPTDTISTPPATPAPASISAADVAAARKALEDQVAALRADGVHARDIELQKFLAPLPQIKALVEQHATAFASEGVTPALLAAIDTVASDLGELQKTLPADFRTLRTLAQAHRDLVSEAYAQLGRYTAMLSRKARGERLNKAARELGLGGKRSHSLRSLVDAYQTVLHGAQDTARCQALGITPDKVAAMQAMYEQLVAAVPSANKKQVTDAAVVLKLELLQMALEVFYGDVGAAAEWALEGDERLTLVNLLPRSEGGRGKKAEVAPAPAPVEPK